MLTPKKRKFALEYLKDLNGAQAAIRAGYAKNAAKEQAARLLTDANVKEIIEREQAKHAEKSGITIERVLAEYAKIGFADIRKVFDKDGEVLHPQEMDDDIAAAVTSVDVTTITSGRKDSKVISKTHRVKLSDKKNALDSIARHLGMFKDSVELKSDALVSLLQKIDGGTTAVK